MVEIQELGSQTDLALSRHNSAVMRGVGFATTRSTGVNVLDLVSYECCVLADALRYGIFPS